MLCYVKINNFEGLDHSEGQGCTRDTKLESGHCGSCLFYSYRKLNFHYERYICNGCYHCLQYEKTNNRALFRVITTKKGTFRTVSKYFLVDVEKLLEESDLNDRFGWLYKDNPTKNEHTEKVEC